VNEKSFLLKVIRLYHKARKPVFSNNKIRRGRSHSIASSVEDLFATYLIERVKCDLIYIDQPISIEGHKTQIYPDIVLIKNHKIVGFCDVKMDLGWKRKELYDFCKRHASLIAKINGKKAKIRDGLTKRDTFYNFAKNVRLNIVIISDQNISKNVLKEHVRKIEPFKRVVRVFVLTSGEHPNTYGISTNKLLQKIVVNKDAFKNLIASLSGTN